MPGLMSSQGTRAKRPPRDQFLSRMVPRRGLCAFEELAQNGRRADQFLSRMVPRRGLCAFEELAQNGRRAISSCPVWCRATAFAFLRNSRKTAAARISSCPVWRRAGAFALLGEEGGLRGQSDGRGEGRRDEEAGRILLCTRVGRWNLRR